MLEGIPCDGSRVCFGIPKQTLFYQPQEVQELQPLEEDILRPDLMLKPVCG